MGRVWKLGNNINTDVIIPGRYNVTTDRAQLAKYCLYEARPDFSAGVKAGDIIVAGHNFGCGSSREHAPAAILAGNVKVIVARSFARIFYRNAVNIGLPVLICEEAVLNTEDGHELDVDLETGSIRNMTTGQTFSRSPWTRLWHVLWQQVALSTILSKKGPCADEPSSLSICAYRVCHSR